MPRCESIHTVRDRIRLQLAAAEGRTAMLAPIDIDARMAAIRSLAARHDLDQPADSAARLH